MISSIIAAIGGWAPPITSQRERGLLTHLDLLNGTKTGTAVNQMGAGMRTVS